MGVQDLKYDGPTEILAARDLRSVAKYMKSDECRNVFVMLGAGVSTSAGIPDFRSPETGLYANLARLNLPYPEAVFEINFFRKNPAAFYTLARELLPGRFRPTLTHSFIRLLADKSLLRKCFTQNIDTLERRAGVPVQRIVEAHGSFANQHCIECRTEFDSAKMKECLKTGEIAVCGECQGLVKPDIVFFGESLPELFHQSIPQLRHADLLFVIGTSLTVQPFASLASMVPRHCPRVLINLDHVGDFGRRPDDVICLGKCDEVVMDLCKELNWKDELEAAWKETEDSVTDLDEKSVAIATKDETEEERLEEEVEDIRDKLARVLGIRQATDADVADTDPETTSAIITGEEVPVVDDQCEDQREKENKSNGTGIAVAKVAKDKL